MKLHSAPYKEYKKSDNEWDELIPADWNEERVKDIFNLITDTAPANNDFELLSLYASIGVRPRKEMEQRGNKAVTTDGYWMVKKGDIVVNKLLAWMGAIGLSEYEGVTSPAYDILRKASDQVDERFYTYLFRTKKSQAIFKRHSRGIMDVRLRLYFDKFGAITVPFPSISEQQAIATYLDTKTAQIDRKIDLLTQKAQRYEELKRSLINETVTHGLDKSVPTKDSGIDWLGKIPDHWQVRRIKDITASDVSVKTPSRLKGIDLVEFVPMSNVDESLGVIKEFSFVALDSVSSGYTKFKNGDVIFAKITPCMENGNVALAKDLRYGIAFGSTEFMVFRSRKGLLPKYLHYFFHNILFRKNAEPFMKGTAGQKRITSLYMSTHGFGLPPLTEQKDIIKYLDQKTNHIAQIIKNINIQIEIQKELRKTLINDVVTGKIKVA